MYTHHVVQLFVLLVDARLRRFQLCALQGGRGAAMANGQVAGVRLLARGYLLPPGNNDASTPEDTCLLLYLSIPLRQRVYQLLHVSALLSCVSPRLCQLLVLRGGR